MNNMLDNMTEDKISKKNFSIEDALGFGWNIMKKNFWFFCGIILVAGAMTYLPNLPIQFIMRTRHIGIGGIFLWLLLYCIGIIVGVIVRMGYINIALLFHDDKKVTFRDFFAKYPLLFKLLIGNILYGLIILIGFLLLIIPGIIWSIQYRFYDYFIIDQNCSPIDALKKSAAITRDVKWKLFLFEIVLGLITILGFIALIVGMFAAIPTTLVAQTYVYRSLLNQTLLEKL